MTIGSHVAEIARQGIWASLTGGWCYEPANSLFCNTIHLYTWSLLLILPLLIGIFSSGTLTIQIFIGYVVFIVVFFALLKLIITYLHVVFDTTDPIIKYKNKKSLTNDVCRSLRSSFSAPFSNNDIEMMDLGRLRHNNDDEDDDNTQTRRNYIDEPEFAHVLFNNLKSIHEDDSSSSSCSKRSHNGLLDDKTSRIIEPFILPADSFELLPISSHNRRPSEGLTSSRQTTTFKRKLSEPSFEINSIKTRKSRGNSINSIRRVQSTTENIHPFQRRSNSSTYYLRDSKKERKRTTQSKTEIPLEKPNIEEDKPIITTDDGIIDDGQEPCCSKSLQKPKNDIIDDDVEEIIKIDEEGKDLSLVKVPSGMLKKMDRLGQHNLQEINGDSSDFKGKITKFLEELIDTIPETWDAIESVRQNYLERERERPIQRINRHRSIAPPGFSINEGTHVAYDHEDTTEGAVHSFQDENGTWWTYTFNEQGTGIAHPLGSTRAINEMFNQRKSESPNILKKNKVTRHRRHASAAGAVITTERFSIDSNQSGPSRISRISGQNNRRSESLTNDKPLASVTYIDMRPEDELELEKVSNNQEIINNQPQLPTETINERRTKRRRRRRARIHSSSSDEGGNEYISAVPSNIFYPSGQITTINPTEGMPFSRQFMSLAQLASRFAGGNQYPIITAPTNAHLSHHAISSLPLGNLGQQNNSSRRTTLESFADERRRRILTVGGDSSNETREYIRLQMNENDSGDNPQNHPSSASSDSILRNDLAQFGTGIRPRQSHLKPNYYYCLKPFTIGHGLQVKLDRLSVAALFDRNNSIISYFVDIFLAGMVTILATLLISRGIFEEISLLFFAFVVAGSQFSLLKSVQPDASSPVHGFNWLVAYSRPVYFIILSSIILLLDLWATKWNIEQKTTLYETWNWNPFTETKTSKIGIIIGIRDLFCLILLMLPIGFTIGLLPQISTLFMHIFEQIDMFLFGSTASFNLFSSFISLLRSIFVFGLLTLIGHFTYYFDGQSTQNAVFAVYISSIISLSYLMSRWSSNPLFLNILFKNLIPKNIFGCLIIDDDEINDENEQENDINNDGKEIKMKNLKEKEQQQTTEIEIETQNGFTTNNQQQQQQQYSIMGGFKTNDPLPEILKNLLQERIFSDLFYIFINSLVIFGIHCTSVFTATQPYFEINISSLCIVFGFFNHYFYRKLRSHTPWKIFAKPILKSYEFFMFESTVEAKLMIFEKIHVWMLVIEKNILYPLLMTSYLTTYAWELPLPATRFSDPAFSWIVVPISALCGFKIMRTAYGQPQMLFIPLTGAFIMSKCGIGIFQKPELRPPIPVGTNPGFWNSPEIYITPLIVLYFLTVIYPKLQELTLKLNFVLAYIAPWQISWGSAFHAFAQPFSLPHSGMILLQAIFSSLISAPLNPFLGSSFFLMSYVRPIKFWEKDYNTKRVDHSNLRLISQIDRGPMMDDSNLNAIFYEHLTRSLQQSLAGDLQLGRWATTVHPGDCFILASNYLNCLVHIIEIGNGFVTFQVRGLEFRGTYCHQREVEAISEDITDNTGFCCCNISSPPGMLSVNNMFALRWLAWEVIASKYIIDGYSITDNSAVNLLQVHELRRLLVSLYVKCIIYYAITNDNLDKWLKNETILKAMEPIIANHRYVDNDQMFCAANDEDYDLNVMGISRTNFEELYGNWIQHCYERKLSNPNNSVEIHDLNLINCFCYLLGILGRRTLGSASYNRHANAAESFLFGLHALFKGDLRITSSDEWVCSDPNILTTVISPAVRMSLKLHQDHFAAADDFEQISQLYDKIEHYQTMLFISHEHDPAWRQAIISNIPSLLALRHMYDDGQDDYKIIMLNKMHLNMRVIKLNRECVRAFWAGQQQELIFLRNRNPERGSIQNARQVLRNMINSSADQPIGYPIYVSPLTTSFIESHGQIKDIIGSSITFCTIWNCLKKSFKRLKQHFGTSGSTNLTGISQTSGQVIIGPSVAQAGNTPTPYRKRATTGSAGAVSAMGLAGSIGPENKLDDTISIKTAASSIIPPIDLNKQPIKSKRRFEQMNEENEKDSKLILGQTSVTTSTTGEEIFIQIIDKEKIFSRLNEPLKIINDTIVIWPSDEWKKYGGRSSWPNIIDNGMRGTVAHHWRLFHANKLFRSHAGYIYLVRMFPRNNIDGEPFYVPILRDGVVEISKEEFLKSPLHSLDPMARFGVVRPDMNLGILIREREREISGQSSNQRDQEKSIL